MVEPFGAGGWLTCCPHPTPKLPSVGQLDRGNHPGEGQYTGPACVATSPAAVYTLLVNTVRRHTAPRFANCRMTVEDFIQVALPSPVSLRAGDRYVFRASPPSASGCWRAKAQAGS